MNQHVERWPFFTNFCIPFKQVHIALAGITSFAHHDDIVHIIVSTLAFRKNMIYCQFRRINLFATIPTIVVLLYFGDIKFQQVMHIPSFFLICLECLGSYHITRSIILTLSGSNSITQHLQVCVRPIEVFSKIRIFTFFISHKGEEGLGYSFCFGSGCKDKPF